MRRQRQRASGYRRTRGNGDRPPVARTRCSSPGRTRPYAVRSRHTSSISTAPGTSGRPGSADTRPVGPGRAPARTEALRARSRKPMRQPRRPSSGIAGKIRIRLPRDVHRRRRRPDHRAIRDELTGPPGLQQRGSLGRSREPAEQGGAFLPIRPQEKHFARMRIRRARFGVRVVAVVPQRDEPEIGDRREGGRAGADDDPCAAPQGGQERAIPRGRAEVGRQASRIHQAPVLRRTRQRVARDPARPARVAERRARPMRRQPPPARKPRPSQRQAPQSKLPSALRYRLSASRKPGACG